MNDLPKNWIMVSLSEVLDRLQYGYTAKAVEGISPYFLRITDITENGIDWSKVPGCEITKKYLEKYRLREGDIVFARTGSIEKAWLVTNPPNAVFASYLIRGHPLNDMIGSWLSYFIKTQNYLKQIGAAGAGIGRENVNAKKLGQVHFPLPPLAEQRRIVARIEALQSRSKKAKEALDAIPSLLEKLRQSILAAACSGRLTEEWREKNSDVEHTEKLEKMIKEDCLPEVPSSWIWQRMNKIAHIRGGVTKGRKLDNKDTITLPYLRVANVQDGFLDLSEIKQIQVLLGDLEKYRLANGDILFTEGGDRDKLGRGTVWRGEIVDCIHQNHIFRARLYANNILPNYISLATKSEYARDYFYQNASQTVNLASINLTNLGNLPIPIPPLAEQEVIVHHVESLFRIVDKVEEQYKKIKAFVDQLDQSILAKAFRGELVPQDPNDEPASTLLERIQTERKIN